MAATEPAAGTHDHLPWFITAPGQTDTLFIIVTVLVVGIVLMLGIVFFWLHSLPERMGHKKLQFEIVAVLALLSLFTHIHLFWVIALLLALIDLPDFLSPLRRLAGAAERLSGMPPGDDQAPPKPGREPGHRG
jgi:hypothetical protein